MFSINGELCSAISEIHRFKHFRRTGVGIKFSACNEFETNFVINGFRPSFASAKKSSIYVWVAETHSNGMVIGYRLDLISEVF